MPSGRPRYPGLTPREQEVYELLRLGLTNPQIAERLGISLDGAKYQVSQILMKLDVATREEAVALASQRRAFGFAGIGVVSRKLSLGGVMKTTTVAVLAGALVVVALIAVGVFVAQSRSDDDSAEAPDLPLTLGGEPSAFLALLEYVPAVGDSTLYYSDYAAAREFLGVQPPSQDAEPAELIAYWGALSAAGMQQNPISANFTNSAATFNAEVGLNIANLDASLHLGPEEGECGGAHVFAGRFDTGRIDSTLRQSASFRDAVKKLTHAGVGYFWWHNGCSSNGALGGPGQMVISDDLVYWSSQSSADTVSMIEASGGMTASLPELQPYQLIAQAFAETGVFSAYVQVHSDPLWFEPARELAEGEYGRNGPNVVEAQGYLRPYTGFAVGVGRDAEGTYAVLVFLHSNAEDAATNARILEARVDSGTRYRGRPWSDTITRRDITVDGTVLQARLWAADPGFLLQAWRDLDSLFVSRP
jgi:DNA-binding CsgD family transcriptional regulator